MSSQQYPFSPGLWERITAWASFALLSVGLVWSLFIAPADAYQGEVQRLIYVHVPSAWVTFLAFFVIFIASVQYLRTKEQRYDTIAHAGAGVGIVFCALALITGSIWGRYAWGVWWTWDARLTTTAVLFLIYAVYLIVRNLVDEEGQRARFAAVVGIIGFVDVPIIHMSVYWWRTLHQPPSIMRPDGPKMALELMLPLLFMVVAAQILFAHLIIARRRMHDAERSVESKQQEQLNASGV